MVYKSFLLRGGAMEAKFKVGVNRKSIPLAVCSNVWFRLVRISTGTNVRICYLTAFRQFSKRMVIKGIN